MAGQKNAKESEVDLNRIPPLDFSFKKLDNVLSVASVGRPRGGRTKVVPSRGSSNKFITAGVWLNNNNITTMEGLRNMANSLLEYPNRLTWLDLSFNKIELIHSDLLTFPSLRILYLHGNVIQDLQMVVRLKPITSLRTLTLHGNPIDAVPSYRCYVVKIIQQLINLDFVTIAPSERLAAAPPGINELLSNKPTLPPQELFDHGATSLLAGQDERIEDNTEQD